MSNSPLVSVCVITYNSADYVIETLESIKSQTYSNIELIISDDSSKDETVSLCKKWIEQNSSRFVRTEILSPEQNTGTSANYNRGVEASKGEWIKFIDGDDILLPNCISDNVNFVYERYDIKVVFSEVLNFTDINNPKTYSPFYTKKKRQFFNCDTHQQLMKSMQSNDMASASFFVNAKLIKENPFDERFKLLEDWPKWIDLLNKGNRFFFLDKITAMYRREESVMHSNTRFYSLLFLESMYLFIWSELMPLIKMHHNESAYDYVRKSIIWSEFAVGFLRNKKTQINLFLFKIFKWYTRHFVKYVIN